MRQNLKIKSFVDRLRSTHATLPAQDLNIKVFVEACDKETILSLSQNSQIAGFIINSTLMYQRSNQDYEAFASEILNDIKDLPILFEIFSDDFDQMEKQGRAISNWGKNAYITIPITNTKGEHSIALINRLAAAGSKINVTAMTQYKQLTDVVPTLARCGGGIVSIFAGDIADAGYDPVPIVKTCASYLLDYPNVQLLWAQTRELYNLLQAEKAGCHIVSASDSILEKIPLLGNDLDQVSLDIVRRLYDQAQATGYHINSTPAAETSDCYFDI